MTMSMDLDMEWEQPPSMLSKLCSRVVNYVEELTKAPKERTLGPNHQLAGTFSVVAPELIEQVAFFLNTTDNNSFRLTCKYIEHSTFSHWERTCLASIQTDLSHRSFMRLSDLIMQEPLAARVRKIVVTERNFGGLGKGFKWERVLGELYLNTDQVSIRMWTALFSQFDYLRCLKVQRGFTAWDRDERTLLSASDAFTVVMHIITHAQLPVTSFELDFELQNWNSIDLGRIRRTQLVGSPFTDSWAKLQSLSLRLKLTEEAVAGVPYLLMHSCPNVKSLSLDCDGGAYAGRLLHVMAQNRMNAKWKLEELSLRKITVNDVEDLGFFLQHHSRTLRKLKLASITLNEPLIWPKVFALLRDCFLQLESIEVGDLRDFGDARHLVHWPNVSTTSTRDTDGVRFVYHQRRWPPMNPRAPKKNFYIAYQGKQMQTALTLIEEWAVYMPLGP
ncbi:hypothetical protein BJX68DRAFT_261087 [Aspergillus pseudodeflectus]|uniref:F-box domain-containing protein n=1 Tax=Aspergillus pseudodeflectus TaxID=176178 RepID=A0ABR4L6E3_9EURO